METILQSNLIGAALFHVVDDDGFNLQCHWALFPLRTIVRREVGTVYEASLVWVLMALLHPFPPTLFVIPPLLSWRRTPLSHSQPLNAHGEAGDSPGTDCV